MEEERISTDAQGDWTPPAVMTLPAMAELASARRAWPRVAATAVSTIFSLAVHGSVLAAAFIWIEDRPGAVATPTEAISIEFLETEVLEAVETTVATVSTASLESVRSAPGAATESAASRARGAPELKAVEAAEQVEVKDASASETPDGIEVLKGDLETDVPSGVERPDARPSKTPSSEKKERKKPDKTAKLTDPSKTERADSDAKKKGGASSRAAKGSTGSAGRVSASTGSSINYAALVRARVASRKPAGGGRRGTVVVAFGVTRSGGMSFASIARSSGDPGLDRSVLAAVRGAGPFPAPPPGAGLRFAIPFYFK